MMFTAAARQIMLELLAEVPIAASLGGTPSKTAP